MNLLKRSLALTDLVYEGQISHEAMNEQRPKHMNFMKGFESYYLRYVKTPPANTVEKIKSLIEFSRIQRLMAVHLREEKAGMMVCSYMRRS
jgi:hypothetical protein